MKKLITTITLGIITALTTAPTLAQVKFDEQFRPKQAITISTTNTKGQDQIITATSPISATIQILASGLLYIAAPLAVLMLVIGGLRYVTSHGDQTQAEEAKKNITWAIIGLIVIILSWAIIENIIRILISTGTN